MVGHAALDRRIGVRVPASQPLPPRFPMKKLSTYAAHVTYQNPPGHQFEDSFPIVAEDHATATRLAVSYVLTVLGLTDFELRVVGS